MTRVLAHVVGVDDGPFEGGSRGDVPFVAAVCAATRLDGVLVGALRKDGANATERIARLLSGSRFARHLQLVMLQGIALGGFNVVDLQRLSSLLGLPVLAVARRRPDLAAIRSALLEHVPGGGRKWRLIEKAGPMEKNGGVWVQRAGLTPAEAGEALRRTTTMGNLPEPLRLAHLVAGALVTGESRGRP